MFSHITPTLWSLHWLKVRECIEYKILTLTYNALQYHQPSYLTECLTSYNSTLCLQHSFILACNSQTPSACQGCMCQTFLLPLSTLFVEFPSICYANIWSFCWNQHDTCTLSPLLSCRTQNSLVHKVIFTINLIKQTMAFHNIWPSLPFDQLSWIGIAPVCSVWEE